MRLQEAEKRQLGESLMHPGSSERYVHTFRDLSNFSGAVNVTYRYLAGIPLPRKSRFHSATGYSFGCFDTFNFQTTGNL